MTDTIAPSKVPSKSKKEEMHNALSDLFKNMHEMLYEIENNKLSKSNYCNMYIMHYT